MKITWKEGVVHLIFWISTAWLITSGLSIQSHDIEIINGEETVSIVRNNGLIVQILLCIAISVIAFYVNCSLVFKMNQSRTNRYPLVYSALTFALVLLVIYLVTEFRFFKTMPPIPRQIAFGIVIFYFALSIAYSLAKLLIQNTRREQQLLIDKKQAELTLLRNQLHPHFLFNAINNLLSMVNPVENPKLVHSFEQLSHLLRYVIEETHADKVSISKEIGFLKNFIDLQLLRFNEGEVDIQFNVKGEYDAQKLEPGLFIALVENAFTYGTEPEKMATIEIEFDLSRQHTIHFKTKNKVLLTHKKGAGTGIEATRKRLELIYPNKHHLSVTESDDFIVELSIHTK